MNSLIKEQLKKVRVAILPPYDDTTTSLHISRGGRAEKVSTLEIGHRYRVVIDKSLTDVENNWYKTIHGNWNGGNGLQEQSLVITVVNQIGKMIRLDAVGTDNPEYRWSGFLPQSNIGVLEEIN